MDTCSNLHSFDRLKGAICSFYIHFWTKFLKNIIYKYLMSLVKLSHSVRTQNISLFYSNICTHCKCKKIVKTIIVYHGWAVLASIALYVNVMLR